MIFCHRGRQGLNEVRALRLIGRKTVIPNCHDQNACPKVTKNLSGFDSRYCIQVVADIDANGSDRSSIAQANSDGVAVEGSEVVKSDGGEDVAPIIKRHQPEAFFDRIQGEAQLGVQDEQLVAAVRHRDFGASRRIVGIAARDQGTLWARAVKGEAARVLPPPGENSWLSGTTLP